MEQITIDPKLDAKITDTFYEAWMLAITKNVEVRFVFNGIEVTVREVKHERVI